MSEAARKLVELTRPAASRSASAPSVNGGQTYTPRRGTVQSVADGIAEVALDGGEGTTPCSMVVKCKTGDRVVVHIYAHEARVTGNITSPATDDEEALAARTVADEAAAIAQATDQHFWHDTNGAHVTDVEQDEWKQAEQEGTLVPTDEQPYHNLLMNSLGILIRRAKNVLASFSKSAVAFYDGLWDGTGDGSSHVVARFGSDGAQIGKNDEIHLEQGASGVSVMDDSGSELLRFGVAQRDGHTYADITSSDYLGIISNEVTDFRSGNVFVNVTSRIEMDAGNIPGLQSNLSLRKDLVRLWVPGSNGVVYLGASAIRLDGVPIGRGVQTITARNLSPFFAHDLTDRTYWYNGQAVTNLLNASSYAQDGWAHVSIPATSVNTQYNVRITRAALEGVVTEGEDVTLLVELANVSTTGSTGTKLYQPANMTGELVQLAGASDLEDGSHWFDGTATGTGGEGLCLQLWSGTEVCEFDVRVSLFIGNYRGAYKPYVVPECELQDVLGLTVESTTTVADIVTASSGFTCTAADFTTYGKVAMGTCTFRADANVSANAVTALGTLADGKRPAKLAGATLGAGTSVYGNAQITNAGLIQLRPTAQVAAGTTFHVRFDYILA